MKPVLFIITGSNGAGKSTVGSTYLPDEIQKNYTVFDGDKTSLQRRLKLYPLIIPSLKEARKSADEWMYKKFINHVKKALATHCHFAYEGHFRDVGTLKIPRRFKKNGYDLSIIFMGLADSHQSELRVIDRAKHGGHNVPIYEIESNFYGNLIMLNKNYKLFDEIIIIDTSKSLQHKILLHIRNSKILFYTLTKEQPAWLLSSSQILQNLLEYKKENNNFYPAHIVTYCCLLCA